MVLSDKNRLPLLVALAPSGTSDTSFHVVPLPDPSSTEHRDYLLGSAAIYELQCIESEYCSCLVNGTWMVGNNEGLQVMTPVDPLFFVIAQHDGDGTTWQPLSQLLPTFPSALVPLLSASTLRHLYKAMDLGGGTPDDVVFKFSVERALRWLVRKQAAVQNLQFTQLQQEQQQQTITNVQERSAFDSSFCPGQDVSTTAAQQPHAGTSGRTLAGGMARLERQALNESVQVVCQYLNATWRVLLLQHLDLSADDTLLSDRERAKKRRLEGMMPTTSTTITPDCDDWNARLTQITPMAKSESKIALAKPVMTAGAKKLAKTNIKGMKVMSAFFSVKKA